MREYPNSLTSDCPFVLFVEIAPWASLVGTELENHYFARKKDKFWSYFNEYDIGMLFASDGEELTALDDQDVHEVAKIDFTFYTNDAIEAAEHISNEELMYGKDALKKLIEKTNPGMICFVGAVIFKHFFSTNTFGRHGLQETAYQYKSGGQTKVSEVFVLPSSFRTNFGIREENLRKIWKELQLLVHHLKTKNKKKISNRRQ